MTTQELINYYANLLILQYLGQPNAYATIQALVKMVIMDQIPTQVQDAFNMDGTAVGVQLDVLGKYAGVIRTGYNLSGQPITLDDSDFFKLIKMAILTNNAQSDLASIQRVIQIYFAGEMFVFDHKEMRISYLINSAIGSQDLIALFITEGLLPKPMGVQLSAPIYTSPLKFFGMVSAVDVSDYATQNSLSIAAAAAFAETANNISPFNSAAAPITGVWLSAKLGIPI